MGGFFLNAANMARATVGTASSPGKPATLATADILLDAEPDKWELERAGRVLSAAGVRIMNLAGVITIGLWSDLDSPSIREALRVFGSERLPVRYLDGAGIPMRYKVRRVAGEPVPMNVLAAMEREPADPWRIRNQMLSEMGYSPTPVSWDEWKASALNKLFEEQGVGGRRGHIKAETVRAGLAHRRAAWLKRCPPGHAPFPMEGDDPPPAPTKKAPRKR
jgi:hypothetical protein